MKYDNPKALPQFFVDNADLHTLRICLGMYPDEDIADKSKIPEAIAQVLSTMPVWYQSKVMQMSFVADQFTVGQLRADGVYMACQANSEDIKQLCAKYE